MTTPRSEDEWAFTEDELTHGYWVKIGEHGVSRVVEFSPDRTLSEQDLFSPIPFFSPRYEHSWLGHWQLERAGRELIITVGRWRLHVEPERRSNIHRGYEQNTENPEYRLKFRLIHVG